jgi:hypothetical protein
MSTAIQYLPEEAKRERKMVVVDRELERIYKKNQNITPDLVLEAATSPKHPLHDYFEWNDTVAGQKYRKAQAYTLILASRYVVQLVENGKVEHPSVKERGRVRRLVSAFRGEGFKMRNEALADTDMRTAIVETKKGALRSWCQSTIDIEELQPLRSLILKQLGEV